MDSRLAAIETARIFTVRSEQVAKLAGFEKHHKIPTTVGPRSRAWVDNLTGGQLNQDMQDVVDGLRANFQFKRRQLDIHGPEDRRGVIETPFFSYEVSVDFDENDPSQVVWRREINRIRDIDQILSPPFSKCFSKSHWRLEILFENEVEVVDIIDRVEDLESPEISIDYGKDLTWCKIALATTTAKLHISAQSIQIYRTAAVDPQELVAALLEFQSHLFAQIGTPGIGQKTTISDNN